MDLKFTNYFQYMRKRGDRNKIKMEWIRHTYENPEKEEVQQDGRIRR
jgi:hypothetical protein